MPRFLTAVLLVLLGVSASDAADDLDQLLSRPASPGSLAVLLPHARDVRVQERWIQALAHDDPRVRAAAARLLHLVGNKAAVPALTRVLQQEADRRAAGEHASALLALASDVADLVVLSEARRFDARPFALEMARTRGGAAVVHLERMQALQLDLGTWLDVLPLLVAGRQSALDRAIALALEKEDAALCQSALQIAIDEPLSVDVDHLAAAVTSRAPAIRDLAWWQMAIQGVTGKPLPETTALPPESDPVDSTPEMAFGRELLSRLLTGVTTEQRSVIEREGTRPADFDLPPFARAALKGPLNRLLTKAERRAFKAPDSALPLSGGPTPFPGSPDTRQYDFMRAVADMPAGYVESVLAETGCEQRPPGALAVMGIRHPREGTPGEVTLTASDLSEPCMRAARLILTTARVPAREVGAGQMELLVLPLHDGFLECLAAQDTDPPSSPMRVGSGRIDPPKKIRHVPPAYPEAAQRSGLEGIVIIESTISPHGCVSRAEVLRSAHVALDVAAINAVTGWTFTPTLLNGKPVPVLMTVTVQFTLR